MEPFGSSTPFPKIPTGWFYIGRSAELQPGPAAIEVGGFNFVCFRDSGGTAVTLAARCAHMGADLSKGDVINGLLRCPLHGWEYASDGRCARIPVCDDIPPFARQKTFPTVELAGHVLFYNASAARFDAPFFDGVSPDELRPAKPFAFKVKTPWYMIGANAFDAQHFRVAHDRTLVGELVIDSPSPFARRIEATYDVSGDSLRDWLIRRFSGPQVRMSVTVWAGNLILVTAKFKRMTSYGMVFVRPLDECRTEVRTIVWIRRSEWVSGRALIDPLRVLIRRWFIHAFMSDDAQRSSGVTYNPKTLIEADRELRDYMTWLAGLCAGDNGKETELSCDMASRLS